MIALMIEIRYLCVIAAGSVAIALSLLVVAMGMSTMLLKEDIQNEI